MSINNLQDIINKVQQFNQDEANKQELNSTDRLEINKYITEKSYEIIESIIEQKRKTLLVAPMKAGKSTFSFKELYPVMMACNYQFIFVSPKTSLLEQVQDRYKVNSCYGGSDATITNLPVISTPDSLYKVINKCEEVEKEFIIVYDEIHEMELNYNHRHKLIYPYKYYDNPLCRGLLGLTATPDNVIRSIKWDKVFTIKVKDKFIQSPVTNLIMGLSHSVKDMTIHIVKTYVKYKVPIIVRINDKKKIDEIKTSLGMFGLSGIHTWYRNNLSEEDNKLLSEMLNGVSCDFNILLTTSLVDVGVELTPMRKPIVIDFMDHNSRIIENIQFLGRFREGVFGYDLVIPKSSNEYPFMEYEQVHQQLKESARQTCLYFNNDWKRIKNSTELLKTEYNPDTEEYSYSIDEFALNSKIFEFWIKQIIKDTDRLKDYLENHLTFNTQQINTVYLNEKYTESKQIDEIIEVIKADKKATKEEFKSELDTFIDEVKQLTTDQIEVLLTKPDDIKVNDKWRVEEMQPIYDFYYSENMKEYRKRFYKLEGWTVEGYYRQEILLKALDDKWYRTYKRRTRYIESNFLYDKTEKLIEIDQQLRNTKVIVYAIRDAIVKLKGKEIGVKLSGKFKNQLLDILINEKCLSKVTAKTLDKHLNEIYSMSEDRFKAITSIKKTIIFD